MMSCILKSFEWEWTILHKMEELSIYSFLIYEHNFETLLKNKSNSKVTKDHKKGQVHSICVATFQPLKDTI